MAEPCPKDPLPRAALPSGPPPMFMMPPVMMPSEPSQGAEPAEHYDIRFPQNKGTIFCNINCGVVTLESAWLPSSRHPSEHGPRATYSSHPIAEAAEPAAAPAEETMPPRCETLTVDGSDNEGTLHVALGAQNVKFD